MDGVGWICGSGRGRGVKELGRWVWIGRCILYMCVKVEAVFESRSARVSILECNQVFHCWLSINLDERVLMQSPRFGLCPLVPPSTCRSFISLLPPTILF